MNEKGRGLLQGEGPALEGVEPFISRACRREGSCGFFWEGVGLRAGGVAYTGGGVSPRGGGASSRALSGSSAATRVSTLGGVEPVGWGRG